MNRHIVPLFAFILIIFSAGLFLSACGASSTPAAIIASNPVADGQALLQTRCTDCHSLSRVVSAHLSASQWQVTVDRMIRKGAQLNPQEEQVLIDYLMKNYP